MLHAGQRTMVVIPACNIPFGRSFFCSVGLDNAIEGLNQGAFGLQSDEAVLGLVAALEDQHLRNA